MRLYCLVAALVLISSPGITQEMLDKGSVESGFTFRLDHQWGERYEDGGGEGQTHLDCSAETGIFIVDRLSAGIILRGAAIWEHDPEGYIDVGPRLALYFYTHPDGAFYWDASVRYGRASDDEFTTIAMGLGHLFKLNSHVGITTGFQHRWLDFKDEQARDDITELEFRGGLRIYLFGGDK